MIAQGIGALFRATGRLIIGEDVSDNTAGLVGGLIWGVVILVVVVLINVL